MSDYPKARPYTVVFEIPQSPWRTTAEGRVLDQTVPPQRQVTEKVLAYSAEDAAEQARIMGRYLAQRDDGVTAIYCGIVSVTPFVEPDEEAPAPVDEQLKSLADLVRWYNRVIATTAPIPPTE